MKRQVYVPFSLLENGKIPEKAVLLSRETKLGIQVGDKDDSGYGAIQVIEIPERQGVSYHKQVNSGFIQSFDYLDEFSIFDKSTQLDLKLPDGNVKTLKPRIKERHVLKYRERLYDEGSYSFSITSVVEKEEKILVEGFFEVI
jgi:hypothetical protein